VDSRIRAPRLGSGKASIDVIDTKENPQIESAPLVSVYLPTRNRRGLLEEAVQSVIDQSFREFELLIVDDGSDDDTDRFLRVAATHDPRIRTFRFEQPRGAPAARNLAIANARGRFISGIDDDDLMLPERLEQLLNADPSKWSLVCSGLLLEKSGVRRPLNARRRIININDIYHYNMVGNQAMMLTERARAIGGFDETFVASQDYDFWTRSIEYFGPALRLSTPTYVMRMTVAEHRITHSSRFAEGARQYTAKHGSKMNSAQRRSQNLVQTITARRTLTWSDLMTSLALGSAGLFLRYWASGQPLIRKILRR
jgi:glycosyltransferase involved in cell wall biosynthesis